MSSEASDGRKDRSACSRMFLAAGKGAFLRVVLWTQCATVNHDLAHVVFREDATVLGAGPRRQRTNK